MHKRLGQAAFGFEAVEASAQFVEQAGGSRQVLFDPGDIRMRRVIGDFIVDIDLVDDRGRELTLLVGYQQHAPAIVGAARPLDHHGHVRSFEPPPQHLRLQLRPFSQLDEAVAVLGVIVEVIIQTGRLLVNERDPAFGAQRRARYVLRST